MKKIIMFLFVLSIICENNVAQQFLSQKFYETHGRYIEKSLNEKRIKHKDINPLIQNLMLKEKFDVEQIGKSIEDREIYVIRYGNGPINVLLWSQMHGDEPTATMALFDIFNFLHKDDEFNDFRANIFEKLTLHFIPMLNPDGSEKYERENAVFIDLNRDALRLQSPESQVLKNYRDKIDPEFGFNLHDQKTRYSAGKSYKQATVTFLAPSFNYEKEINEVRKKTMQLIVNLHNELTKFIPGHVGKWNDDFEPRAFGDNMVKWGTSSVLIESGGWKDDVEKQFIRKLNFISVLNGFHSIADGIYKSTDITNYEKIPENDDYIFDLILRNLNFTKEDYKVKIDVGVFSDEENIGTSKEYYHKSSIEEIGDLSIFYGLNDIDCSGLELVPGKTFPKIYSNLEEITKLDFTDLYKKGFTSVRLEKCAGFPSHTNLPINIYCGEADGASFALEEVPEFVIMDNGNVKFVVINGFIYDLESGHNYIRNGLIIK